MTSSKSFALVNVDDEKAIESYDLSLLQRESPLDKRWLYFDGFFSLIVIFNGVVIWIQTNRGTDSTLLLYLENIILGLFVLEILLRIAWLGLYKWVHDGWNMFDFVVVIIAAIDLWVLKPIGVVGSDSDSTALESLVVLRIFRLLRLVRLVKLFRFFRELWLLIRAILVSVKTVFWTCMILILVIYVSAIFTTELIGKTSGSFDSSSTSFFSTISTSMFTLFQITTWDNWTSVVGPIVSEAPVFIIFFILYFYITSFSLLNVLVGVMCSAALKVNADEDEHKKQKTSQSRALLLHEGLCHLRVFNYRPHFSDSLYIKHRELFASYFHPDLSDIFEKTSSDIGLLRSAVQALGEDPIKISEAIDVLRQVEPVTSRSITTAGTGTTRVLNTMSILNSIEVKHKSVRFNDACVIIENSLSVSNVVVLSTLWTQLNSKIFNRMNIKLTAGSTVFDACDFRPPLAFIHDIVHWERSPEADSPKGNVVTAYNFKSADRRKKTREDLTRIDNTDMTIFDLVFGVAVCLFGVFMGISVSATNSSDDLGFYLIDSGFVIIFTIEFYWRWIVFTEDKESSFEIKVFDNCFNQQDKVNAWKQLRKRGRRRIEEDFYLRFGLIPTNPHSIQTIALPLNFKHFLSSDGWIIFDFIIVVVSLLDNFIFEFIFSGLSGASAIAALRVLRILRLVRLVRVVRMFGELLILVNSMLSGIRIVFWGLLTTLIGLYVFAILIIELIVNEVTSPSESLVILESLFSTIGRSLLTFFQVITFDSTEEIYTFTRSMAPNTGTKLIGVDLVFLIALIVFSLGVLNLIVGVMCSSSVHIVEKDRIDQEKDFMRRILEEIHIVVDQVNDVQIDGNTDEPFLRNGFIHKRFIYMVYQYEVPEDLGKITTNYVESDPFGKSRRIFVEVCGHKFDNVLSIFESLADPLNPHYVDLETFIEAMIARKDSINFVDALVAKTLATKLNNLANITRDNFSFYLSRVSLFLPLIIGMNEAVFNEYIDQGDAIEKKTKGFEMDYVYEKIPRIVSGKPKSNTVNEQISFKNPFNNPNPDISKSKTLSDRTIYKLSTNISLNSEPLSLNFDKDNLLIYSFLKMPNVYSDWLRVTDEYLHRLKYDSIHKEYLHQNTSIEENKIIDGSSSSERLELLTKYTNRSILERLNISKKMDVDRTKKIAHLRRLLLESSSDGHKGNLLSINILLNMIELNLIETSVLDQSENTFMEKPEGRRRTSTFGYRTSTIDGASIIGHSGQNATASFSKSPLSSYSDSADLCRNVQSRSSLPEEQVFTDVEIAEILSENDSLRNRLRILRENTI